QRPGQRPERLLRAAGPPPGLAEQPEGGGLTMPVTGVTPDLERFAEAAQGVIDPPHGQVGLAELAQAVGLRVLVAKFAEYGQRLLVAADGLVVTAQLAVGSPARAEGDPLAVAIAGRTLDRQRPLAG